MTLFRHYLTEYNRDLRRLRLQLKTTQIGLIVWGLLAVFVVLAAAESIIKPPLPLTGEEALREGK